VNKEPTFDAKADPWTGFLAVRSAFVARAAQDATTPCSWIMDVIFSSPIEATQKAMLVEALENLK
jgi:hypothetical protein